MHRLSDENVSGELGISHKQKLNITTTYIFRFSFNIYTKLKYEDER